MFSFSPDTRTVDRRWTCSGSSSSGACPWISAGWRGSLQHHFRDLGVAEARRGRPSSRQSLAEAVAGALENHDISEIFQNLTSTILLQDDPEGLGLGYVDLVFESSLG